MSLMADLMPDSASGWASTTMIRTRGASCAGHHIGGRKPGSKDRKPGLTEDYAAAWERSR